MLGGGSAFPIARISTKVMRCSCFGRNESDHASLIVSTDKEAAVLKSIIFNENVEQITNTINAKKGTLYFILLELHILCLSSDIIDLSLSLSLSLIVDILSHFQSLPPFVKL